MPHEVNVVGVRLERLEIWIERIRRPETAEIRPGDEHAAGVAEVEHRPLDPRFALEKRDVDAMLDVALRIDRDELPGESGRWLPFGSKRERGTLMGLV